jgi:hypothetical protein
MIKTYNNSLFELYFIIEWNIIFQNKLVINLLTKSKNKIKY